MNNNQFNLKKKGKLELFEKFHQKYLMFKTRKCIV